MWNKIRDSNLFVKCYNHECCELFVTDFVNIWATLLSEQELSNCIKESNPESEDNEFLEQLKKQIMDMLTNNPEKIQSTVVILPYTMKINMIAATVYGCPVKLNITLTKGCQAMFFKRVTLPLINTVRDLATSQTELFNLLSAKDNEIKDFKLEGAKRGLEFYKTVVFNKDNHLEKHTTYTNEFGNMELLEEVSNKKLEEIHSNGIENLSVKQEVEVKQEIKVEPTIKQEPESQPSTQSTSSMTSPVKQEIQQIKKESETPKKKRKRLLNL